MLLKERSAGAVVFNDNGGATHFLLLHYPAGHWDFPKGNIEEGEAPVETVRREIFEETGIKRIHILKGFGEKVDYFYRRDSEPVHKSVIYLLAQTKTREVTLSYEHKGYAWLSLKEALNKVTYKNSKQVLQDAAKFLRQASVNRDVSSRSPPQDRQQTV